LVIPHLGICFFDCNKHNNPTSCLPAWLIRCLLQTDSNLPTNLPSTFPVLFIWGKDDPTCSPKHVERMRALVEGEQEGRMKVVALDGVSHWVPWQAKEAVAEEVKRFVREVVDGPGVKL
jgi:pimeloyl-ACP methyl ester carboxylesterase